MDTIRPSTRVATVKPSRREGSERSPAIKDPRIHTLPVFPKETDASIVARRIAIGWFIITRIQPSLNLPSPVSPVPGLLSPVSSLLTFLPPALLLLPADRRMLMKTPRPATPAAIALALFSSLAAPAVVRAANEIGFVEKFALAADREEALRQLIPGTEEFYFYHALHLQNLGKRAEFRELLAQWAKRTPQSPSRQALETRQALLDYGVDPQATLAFLRQQLGLGFNHEREVPSEKPNLPVALDGGADCRRRSSWQLATAGVDHLDQLSERAVARLVATGHAFSPAQRRAALAKLTRPDVAGLGRVDCGGSGHAREPGIW